MHIVGGEMVLSIEDIDQPLLWIMPFSLLTLIILVSLVNIVLHFLPEQSGYYLMFSACILLGASTSGFITELIKGRGKYVYVSMSVAVFLCAMAFLMGYGFFKSNITTRASTATIPIISNLISNITLTILPGVFVGAVVGGGVGFLPDESENKFIEKIEELKIEPVKGVGYEKTCKRCDAVMPFDSLYCYKCGGTLKRKRADTMKYCRYCGNRLYFLGEFCPDCGKEINIISKPKVFQSI
jgi:hypothetical protein